MSPHLEAQLTRPDFDNSRVRRYLANYLREASEIESKFEERFGRGETDAVTYASKLHKAKTKIVESAQRWAVSIEDELGSLGLGYHVSTTGQRFLLQSNAERQRLARLQMAG
jgi:hypothetical protein